MPTKKKRTIRKNSELYHYYYKRTGFYKTLFFSVLKLSAGIVFLIAAFVILSNYMIDLETTFINVVETVPRWFVFVLFFASDSLLLSIVPPDLFILWADSFDHKFLILLTLGSISYAAGIFSYFLGKWIALIPTVHRWISKKLHKLMNSVNKWGGAFLIVAALLPIPWSPALIVTGMLNYKFKNMLLVTLARFVRFFIYGAVLFNVIDIF